MAHRRIDVQQHLVPRSYADWLRGQGITHAGGRELPAWSAEDALRMMDAHASGFVPHASHRLAAAPAAETGRSPFEILDDLASDCD